MSWDLPVPCFSPLPNSSLFSHVVSFILSSFPITTFCSLDFFCLWSLSSFSLSNIHEKDPRQFKINHTMIINSISWSLGKVSVALFMLTHTVPHSETPEEDSKPWAGTLHRKLSVQVSRALGFLLKITNGVPHIVWTYVIPD